MRRACERTHDDSSARRRARTENGGLEDTGQMRSNFSGNQILLKMALNAGGRYDLTNFTEVLIPRGKKKLDALPVIGKVTIVELWATWCDPCINTIPHLTSLQLEFKDDIEVIGFTGQEEPQGLEHVQSVCRSMGDKMQYTVLSLNAECEMPEDFRDFEFYPHAMMYDKNGTLIYKGSPNDTKFEQTLRWNVTGRTNHTRRAVFLQASNLPSMDNLSQSDPFCAVFVKPVKSENGKWAMCGFGPYFPGQCIPPHKAAHKSQQSKDKESGQPHSETETEASKQDPTTMRNQMMATEVIRDRNDAVWSNYFIADSANYPEEEWEVMFAVYDHDDGAAVSKWDKRKVCAQRRCVRVVEEHSAKRPAEFNQDVSFFVTDDMIQNPSNTLFRGKHELIGKVRANLQETFFPSQPKKYLSRVLHDWQGATVSKKTKQPEFTIHSYDFSTMGSPHTFSIKAKLEKEGFSVKKTPALFVFTSLPHNRDIMRVLYNDVHCADSTYDPDFPSFVINSVTDTYRNLAFSQEEDDQDGSKALSLAEIIFVLRDVDDASNVHDVGTEIGRFKTTIEKAKQPMKSNSKKGDHSITEASNTNWWLRPPCNLLRETSPGSLTLTENPLAAITYLSCVPTASIEDRCARNAVFDEAAQTYFKSIIDTLYNVDKTKTCSHPLCPYNSKQEGFCLNLENMGLLDGDLEEIFSIVAYDETEEGHQSLYDTDTETKLKAIRKRWRQDVRCVNLNGNAFEFNVNFWSIRWPINMTCLHLDDNRIEGSGWAKVFFSLAKWICVSDKKLKRDVKKEGWPLRFFELSSKDDCVFSDSTDNVSSTKDDTTVKLQSFPRKFIHPKDAQPTNPDHEAVVNFLNSFVKLVAGHRFKNSVKDDVACFLSNEVFERSLVLNQYSFFMCIRDLLWQIDNGVQAMHSKEKVLYSHDDAIVKASEPESFFGKTWHALKNSDLWKNGTPRFMNIIGLLFLLYSAVNSCLLIFFVPQLCDGNQCGFDDHLKELKFDPVSRWGSRPCALVINFISLFIVSITLIVVAWREDCLIVDLDAVSTLPENQVQAVLMWNTPDSVGKVVKRKQFYDVEIGKLKTKHRHLHRAVFVLAILSELIFVANFILSGYVIWNRAVNYLTYVNYFSQLATMSILMLGLVVNVWTDDGERNYTRTMYRSHRQMFNMLDPKLVKNMKDKENAPQLPKTNADTELVRVV